MVPVNGTGGTCQRGVSDVSQLERFHQTWIACWSKPRMYIRGSAHLGRYTPCEDALVAGSTMNLLPLPVPRERGAEGNARRELRGQNSQTRRGDRGLSGVSQSPPRRTPLISWRERRFPLCRALLEPIPQVLRRFLSGDVVAAEPAVRSRGGLRRAFNCL